MNTTQQPAATDTTPIRSDLPVSCVETGPGGARKVEPLHRNQIIEGLREDGRTYQEIARILGVTARQIENALGEVAALHGNGLSVREIALTVGAPVATVHRVLYPAGRASRSASRHAAPAVSAIADMYGMQVDVLAWYLNVATSTVYKLVKQLQAEHLVLPLHNAGPGMNWVLPTRDGAASYLGWTPRTTWRPPAKGFDHYRAVAQARTMLVGTDAERWLSERRMRHAVEQQRYQSRRGPTYTQPHLHDGRFLGVVGGENGWWALEVELTPKSTSLMDKALRGAIRAARDADEPMAGVLYLCRGLNVHRVVSAAADRLPDKEFGDLTMQLVIHDFDADWNQFLERRSLPRRGTAPNFGRSAARVTKDAS